jgi:hypothetical protein
MLGKVDPAFENRGTIAALVSQALTRLRRLCRWWSYRPERRYMRDSGHMGRGKAAPSVSKSVSKNGRFETTGAA